MAKIAVVSARSQIRSEVTAYLAQAGHLAASFTRTEPLVRQGAGLPFDIVVIDLEAPGSDQVATLREEGLRVPIVALLPAGRGHPLQGPGSWATRLVEGPAPDQVLAAVEDPMREGDQPARSEGIPTDRGRRALRA